MNERRQKQLGSLKKWLGDNWGYPDSQISINETKEEKNLSDKDLKNASKKYAKDNFQGKKYFNPSAGREILVSRDGLDKWDSITKSREQSISIKKLDRLLENCQKTGISSDNKERKSVDGFTYFEHPINVNENQYAAKIATKETNNGENSKYYYHFLEDKKNEPN